MSAARLGERAHALEALTAECRLCPRACLARRLEGEAGECGITDRASVFSAAPHYGEEPPLVGASGSGTIFFSSCTLHCLYCQNHDISTGRGGRPVSAAGLAGLMLHLQQAGCHNINLVTPTHVTAQIAAAVAIAAGNGLRLPLVYNCGGYESVETLRLLEDIVDIYMPDIKYSDDQIARECSGVEHYWERAREALAEMQRQVGDLRIDEDGIARRGVLIRHLVLPGEMAGSRRVLEFIGREISVDAYVNIMDQYHPAHRAFEHPVLHRAVTGTEVERARQWARSVGLHRGFEPGVRARAH
jgi:putative pyruvate formate lyase activating enzyme